MTLTVRRLQAIAAAGKGDDRSARDADADHARARRIATRPSSHRDKRPDARPWIAVYGGALHNDRFPDKGVEEWSYAADGRRG